MQFKKVQYMFQGEERQFEMSLKTSMLLKQFLGYCKGSVIYQQKDVSLFSRRDI